MRAVLFDLDGTLLDLDLGGFLQRYFVALEAASAPLAAIATTDAFMPALGAAVNLMTEPHPGRTNQDVFYEGFEAATGIDLTVHWSVFETFYREVFPTLRAEARPANGARLVVTTALDLGLKVAIATNPIFPRLAIDQRLAWASLDDLDLPVITSYEAMTATKPHAAYYLQTAELLGVSPAECMMVGDDRVLDMAAADVGMRTYYVGSDPGTEADLRGDLEALAELLPRLV